MRYYRSFEPKLTYYRKYFRKNVFHGHFEIAILSQFCTEINILSQIFSQKLTQNQLQQFKQFRHVDQFSKLEKFK